MKLNERLKIFRLENDLTQREFAQKIGISIPTLQKYEYGTLKIKIETIIKICSIFNISLEKFINKIELDDEEKKEISNFETLKELLEEDEENIKQNMEAVHYIIDNSFIDMTYRRKILLYFIAHIPKLILNIPKDKETLEILFDSDNLEYGEAHIIIETEKIYILLDFLEENIFTNTINFIKLSKLNLLQEALESTAKKFETNKLYKKTNIEIDI